MIGSRSAPSLEKIATTTLITMSAAVSGQRLADSWDRAAIPTPFGRGVYQWGAPIHVPRDADEPAMEAARLALEQTLNALTAEAERAIELLQERRTALISAAVTGKIDVRDFVESEAT